MPPTLLSSTTTVIPLPLQRLSSSRPCTIRDVSCLVGRDALMEDRQCNMRDVNKALIKVRDVSASDAADSYPRLKCMWDEMHKRAKSGVLR